MRTKTKCIVLSITIFIFASCAQPQTEAPDALGRPRDEMSPIPASSVAPPQSSPTPAPAAQINRDPKTLALAFYEFYVDGYPRIDDEGPAFSKFLTS